MTAHVLSPEGEWVGFEDFDPAAVEVLKALLTRDNERDSVSPTTESGGRAALTAGPLDDDLPGGVASG